MNSPGDGLTQFLDILPIAVRSRLEKAGELDRLIEVVLDYGRPAEARYRDQVERWDDIVVSDLDLEYVSRAIGEFGTDNRAGIERTLHRISAIRNRHGRVIGLTCRVGRALEGTIDMIDDIVRSGKSILLLGKPGVGKTTKLREIARVLADEVNKRVVIVDTSNEIAGDGDVPHPGIGHARRMQVRVAAEQHNVMIEAVENHMPEVIVIDEIGTEAEAFASRTIAERGVQLVGTAHGQTLENLMLNPTLADLIGGIQAVTLSDVEASRRGTQKTVLERKAPPTFDVVIELLDYDRLAVHSDVQKTVDMILRGVTPRPEIRVRLGGQVEVVQKEQQLDLDEPGFGERFPALSRAKNDPPTRRDERTVESVRPMKPRDHDRVSAEIPDAERLAALSANEDDTPTSTDPNATKLYAYGINRTRLERAIRERHANAVVTGDIADADAVIAIRSAYQARPRKLRDIAGRNVPTIVVKSNTFAQIAAGVDDAMRGTGKLTETDKGALEEAARAAEVVLETGRAQELSPANARVRKQQFQIAEAKKLASEAVGDEPNRRVRILPHRLSAS